MNDKEIANYMNSECFPYRDALKTLTLGVTILKTENNNKSIDLNIDDGLTIALTMLALLDPLNIQTLINVLSFFQEKYINSNIWTKQKNFNVHEFDKETMTYAILDNPDKILTELKQLVEGYSKK